jgi:hypothetical protein
MPFPFGAALMGLSAAGSIATLFGGGGQIQGMGRMQRAQQAQMQTAATAQRYFEAAGDVTNPLFRRTAAMEESRLRRAISEGVMSSQLMARKARARGLTAGVRPEREDESRNRALSQGFQAASEASGGLASERLQATGRGLLGVSSQYGQGFGNAQSLAQMETAGGVAQQQRYLQAADIFGIAGQAMGGGQQLQSLFGPKTYGQSISNASWANVSGLQGSSSFFDKPQFSWKGI